MCWCVPSFLTIQSHLLLSWSATAVIAEHSFFLWKQNPSVSSAPVQLAITKLNSPVHLTKIKTAIKMVSHLEAQDQKHALVKIALENCLCESLDPEVFRCLSLIHLI